MGLTEYYKSLKAESFLWLVIGKEVRGIQSMTKSWQFCWLWRGPWEKECAWLLWAESDPQLTAPRKWSSQAHYLKELTSVSNMEKFGSRFVCRPSREFSPGNALIIVLCRDSCHILSDFWPTKLQLINGCWWSCLICGHLLCNNRKVTHYLRNNVVQSLYVNGILIGLKILKFYQEI